MKPSRRSIPAVCEAMVRGPVDCCAPAVWKIVAAVRTEAMTACRTTRMSDRVGEGLRQILTDGGRARRRLHWSMSGPNKLLDGRVDTPQEAYHERAGGDGPVSIRNLVQH